MCIKQVPASNKSEAYAMGTDKGALFGGEDYSASKQQST